MKTGLKTFFSALALLAFLAVQGADRIGTVDLEKVFREYHKSRAVEDFINRRADSVRLYMKQMRPMPLPLPLSSLPSCLPSPASI